MNVLCFGDSNTFGLSAIDGSRLSEIERWPTLFKQAIGDEHKVIEAGQPNRTLVNNPPFTGNKSGVTYLKPYLEAHQLDVIIIQLGTNDLKARFALTAEKIAEGLAQFINEIELFYQSTLQPRLVIISPFTVFEVGQYQRIYAGAQAKAVQLSHECRRIAHAHNCLFLDGHTLITPCKNEGIHLPATEHKKLANAVFELIYQYSGYLRRAVLISD